MRTLACATVGVALALAAGCGGGQSGGSVAITGGDADQRTLLRSIVDGMAPTAVRRVALRNVGVVGLPDGGWVELRAQPPSNSGRTSLRAQWESFLIAGAFRDRSAGRGLGDVRYIDGTLIAGGSAGPSPSPKTPSVPERMGIARVVAEAAAAERASVEAVELLAPAGPAVALTVQVDDPATFLAHRLGPMLGRWWTSPRLEGGYLIVEDAVGRVLLEKYVSRRIQAGGSRIRPDLAGCDPTAHIWGNPNVEPPPSCPAGEPLRPVRPK